MVELIPDDLCDSIACAGTAAEVKDKVKDWEVLSDRISVGGAWYEQRPERLFENYQALVETFGSATSG